MFKSEEKFTLLVLSSHLSRLREPIQAANLCIGAFYPLTYDPPHKPGSILFLLVNRDFYKEGESIITREKKRNSGTPSLLRSFI